MSGILLHPTSLPGSFGIGDLGPSAYEFINFLVKSGQQIWQILPLGPTGWGNSPYMCFSAFAGNPLLISPERLAESGWISPEDWIHLPDWIPLREAFPGRVVYERVIPFKQALFQKAWQGFKTNATQEQQQAFQAFCTEQDPWLKDYALFMVLKDRHKGAEWFTWDPAYRHLETLAQVELEASDEIQYHKFLQFVFDDQWLALRRYANKYGVRIIGDIPIYVAYNSADVWSDQTLFDLDDTGRPVRVAGVPPDYFSETGQRWGNPLYNWEAMKATGYQWWIDRVRASLRWVDGLRIDHFRGFESYWAVPVAEETAIHGEWLPGPGSDLFHALKSALGDLPIIAEDLGDITPAVLQLRDEFGFPGMKILLFAFGSGNDNPYLPHCYSRNCVVYTGTHDNNTAVGWFYNHLSDGERDEVRRYLGSLSPRGIHWDLIRLALESIADLAIIPLQDVMGLGSDSIMNRPGTMGDNWAWRYTAEMLTPSITEYLAELTVTYNRISPELLAERQSLIL
jgi:4-alpha-glucanotransferase